MKLPYLGNADNIVIRQRSNGYYVHVVGLKPQASTNVTAGNIYVCIRPLQGNSLFKHCYMKLTDSNTGSLIDTRGFFVDAGSAQEPSVTGDCYLVKANASVGDWSTVTRTYDNHTVDEYSVVGRNCCSVALEAVGAVPGSSTPLQLYTANAGTGTVHQCILQ